MSTVNSIEAEAYSMADLLAEPPHGNDSPPVCASCAGAGVRVKARAGMKREIELCDCGGTGLAVEIGGEG